MIQCQSFSRIALSYLNPILSERPTFEDIVYLNIAPIA